MHSELQPGNERRLAVQRIFEQEDWGHLEVLADWDGEDIEDLRSILDDEEFQTLLDRLRDLEGERR